MNHSDDSGISVVEAGTTFLFVPGSRPERFGKAFESGADAVIIDLEDAVAVEDKAEALHHTVGALRGNGVPANFRALVRVNSVTEVDDLVAVDGNRLLGVVVPKAENPAELAAVAAKLPAGCALVALVETAIGVVNARAIAEIAPVTRLAFGAIDFSADVDATAPVMMDHARAELVIASRAAGKPAPLDSPTASYTDAVVIETDARSARALGFGGKLCIHPAQLGAVAVGFAPTPEEIEWATRVVGLDGGATGLDGAMVDKPVVDRAKRILAHKSVIR